MGVKKPNPPVVNGFYHLHVCVEQINLWPVSFLQSVIRDWEREQVY